MSELNSSAAVRAAELAVLVELEARWENLRVHPSGTSEVPSTVHDLHSKQKAYEAFHSKLVAFNKRYSPAHVPELLLNTPLRLGIWCRRMRDLFLQIESGPEAQCPVHLLEKAYRWADGVAAKKGRERCSRPAPGSIRSAVRELTDLAAWCDDLGQVEAAA